jgi:hypothetical protein
VLIEHGGQVIFAGFGEGLASRPSADEMDQSVDSAQFV